MKLKCIGGLADGRVIDVGPEIMYRIGEAVRVPKLTEVVNFNDPLMFSAILAEQNYIYIIDNIKYAINTRDCADIYFLRPSNFTTLDAIQFQFNKV